MTNNVMNIINCIKMKQQYCKVFNPKGTNNAVVNYYDLQATKAETDYHGCGHGWIEIDSCGELLRMRYADNVSDEGCDEQNAELFCRTITDYDLLNGIDYKPYALEMSNQVMRIACDFSCWQAIPVIQVAS